MKKTFLLFLFYTIPTLTNSLNIIKNNYTFQDFNCFQQDKICPKKINIAILIDKNYFDQFKEFQCEKKKDDCRYNIKNRIQNLFYEARKPFFRNLNVVLNLKKIIFYDDEKNNSFSNECQRNDLMLKNFKNWRMKQTDPEICHFHLFSSCNGNSGSAYVNTLCKDNGFDIGVTNFKLKYQKSKTFAHELGHAFGGFHSFENGKYKTGGIMDYSDGKLIDSKSDELEFNLLRKTEFCKTITNLKKYNDFVKTNCGNSIVESGEDCECRQIGIKNCSGCINCKFEKNYKICSDKINLINGNINKFCCENERFLEPSEPTKCNGYCSDGICEIDTCNSEGYKQCFQYPCARKCSNNYGSCSNFRKYSNNTWLKIGNLPEKIKCGQNKFCRNGICVNKKNENFESKLFQIFPNSKKKNCEDFLKTSYPTVFPIKYQTNYPTRYQTKFPTIVNKFSPM
tara:strand:- start:311 stop:1669 length:1359 start_codon:yes stop_codon:yes gene_type:complete